MSSKVKRKVTVENSKESSDHPRRPSVFERLGPGAVNVPSQSQDRTAGRAEHNEKCRNWLRTGTCCYGNTCRYQHDPYPSSSRRSKTEKDIDEKDLRHKMRSKRDETKKSRSGSISPKRKESKRSRSRSRKGEHEGKIKSTVVVTRPRSPNTSHPEPSEKEKKKPEGSWEDDSDDWPMDAAQLDYKEELTLERKRQQLQRELELELQKERMLNENVSFSESSSSSTSSESGSVSSSSDSTSSSSDEDSDESSSSSSSTSSSASRTPIKKKYKKPQSKKESTRERGGGEASSHKKPIDDYDKIKSSRAAKSAWRPRSSNSPEVSTKKGRDRKNVSPSPAFSPKRRSGHDSNLKAPLPQGGRKGPRTPSPLPFNRKQRAWGQSSSTESRSDVRKGRGKRHKKKKDNSRVDRSRTDYIPTPPRLSSPNRTALTPNLGKKSHQKDDGMRGHHRSHEQSPLLLSRIVGSSNSPSMKHGGGHYSEVERFSDKQTHSKSHNRKSDDLSHSRRNNSKEQLGKHQRLPSPCKDSRRLSVSPLHEKYETDSLSRRIYSPLPPMDKDDKGRRHSLSPVRRTKETKDRRKGQNEPEKRRDNRDISASRSHDNRRDNQYRNNDMHRKDDSREVKKSRDDKIKDRGQKDRNLDHDNWSDEPKKNVIRVSDSRRPIEPPPIQTGRGLDRSRDRERDRKKGKDREPLLRTVDEMERERQRLSPSVRVPPDMHSHHVLRDDVPRSRLYEPEIPPDERDYAYGYVGHREPVYLDEHAIPPDYEPDLRGPPLYPPPDPVDYPPPVYPETRYRRDPTLKPVAPVAHIERISAYGARDISPLDPREPIGLPVREEDYLADLPIDDRRAYDERWGRARPVRDDWDPYAPLPPNVLPAHVVASLDEDRYGMPRRRRASPEWLIRRDERDIPLREPRSRSPTLRRNDDVCSLGRGSWGDPSDRHGNRNNDARQDAQQKLNLNQDDRKNRNNRRDRRDRNKRNDEPLIDIKPPLQKEKMQGKRQHSISPGRKDVKKRKEDLAMADPVQTDAKTFPAKKSREDPKVEIKTSSNSRKIKSEPASPKPEVTIKVEKEKPEATEKNVSKSTPKTEGEEKRKPAAVTVPESVNTGKHLRSYSNRNTRGKKRDKAVGDDDFSDWSDGDDDLLNRDDFAESESNSGEQVRSKTEDVKKDKNSKSGDSNIVKDNERKPKRDSSRDSRVRTNELKSESRSRTGSKERFCPKPTNRQKRIEPIGSDLKRLLNYSGMSTRPTDRNVGKTNEKASSEASGTKQPNGQTQTAKENVSTDSVVPKAEVPRAVETDDFIGNENDDYDPISDEELEAMIEEPDDTLMKTDSNEEIKIVDALDINWSTLMNEQKSEIAPSKARNRFKAVHVLSRIGFSQSLAGSELTDKIVQFCQKQLEDEEKEDVNQDVTKDEKLTGESKFIMEHPVAAFHVALSQKKKERQEAFSKIGPSRRALCARQDLHIRKLLCRPVVSLTGSNSMCVQQSNIADVDQCRQSPELKKLECPTPIINAAC